MVADKILASLIGIALGVVVAAAIQRSQAQTDIGTISEKTPFAAICPKMDWPYGCNWHPEATLPLKHLSMRKSTHNRSSLSFFR